jgi:MFS transporter, UMF1 family
MPDLYSRDLEADDVPDSGADPADTASSRGASSRSVAGWALYDLGNTLFSFNVISIYLPLWIVNDMGGRDADYGLANSLSMGLMFLTAPLLGALSDQARGRMPYLVVTTVLCVAFTALLGRGGLPLSLAFFVVANYCYQAGLIFYDALLPAVSTPDNRGRIGGIGVGVGYLGSFVGVGTGLLILSTDPAAKPLVFQVTAALFLLFALPCFFLVREPANPNARPFGPDAVRAAAGQIAQTTRQVRQYRGLGRFLVGRVFYSDAANTLIAFMGIYVTNEVGFGERDTQLLLLAGIAAAIVGGLGWGWIVDRWGPKRTLDAVLGIWVVTFALTAAVGGLNLPGWLFWIAGPMAGVALGGTWAADRPYMLRLSPPRYLGQFYGLYAMVGRFAAIVGPLLWVGIVDGLDLGRPVAVLSLLVMVVISYVILRPISDESRIWGSKDLVRAADPVRS